MNFHSCRGMYKIITWLYHYNKKYSVNNIQNLWSPELFVKWNTVYLIIKPTGAFAWQDANPLVLIGWF